MITDILERPSATDSKETNMTRDIFESCLDAGKLRLLIVKMVNVLDLTSYNRGG